MLPAKTQSGFYAFTSLASRLIRNSSVFLLLLWFGFAATAVAVNSAQAIWKHSGAGALLASLEADIVDRFNSTTELISQPPLHFKDPMKAQKDETKARRRLAAEQKQGKSSVYSNKAVRKNDRSL
ncbi:MAG: hypothetical protein MUD16_14035 [Desulfobacterales bacterium]|nr:hypothetical protein [Desulfobacterales bacterium]